MEELSDEVKRVLLEASKFPESRPMPSAATKKALTTSTPRSASKSTFHALLTTPGFHSSKPETWGEAKPVTKTLAGDEFRKELDATLTTEELEMATKGKEPDLVSDEVDEAMDTLAEQVTQALIDAKAKTFMLGEPMHLTIKKRDGTYSKRPHIGGEEFVPVRVYAGKRGTLIYAFRPVDAADYVEMEMGEAQAFEHFTGLKKHMEVLIERGLSDSVKEAKKAAADKEEQRKTADNFDKYASLGYGSF